MFYCLNVQLYHFEIKIDLCAHTDSKIGIFNRRVYSAYILTRTPPPPFAQVDGGGCYREKFFLIFIFWFARNLSDVWIEIIFLNFTLVILISNFFSFLPFDFYSYFIFFIFSDFVIVLVWFWLSNYKLIISMLNLLILTRFGYAWLYSSTRLIFARYSLSVLRYVYSHQFRLFQHCLFYALTLQLFISSACYKQTFMLMWVCFMLVLAILRLSDVFSFVLGVVYRLGLK